jgi:hypothetical protein
MRTFKTTGIEKLWICLASVLLACFVAMTVVGCDDKGDGGGGSGGTGGGGMPDMAGACSTNPTTHLELINACTDSQAVEITPFYPSMAPNGVLPALPN